MLKQRNASPILVDGTNAVHYVGVGGLGSGFANLPSFYYTPSKESMQSTYGSRKRFNLCEHYYMNQVYLDHTFVYKTDPSPSSASSYYNQTNRLLHQPGADNGNVSSSDVIDTWFGDSFPGLYTTATSDWRNLSARAVHAMWPKIEKDMDESVANSAYELPKLLSVLSLGGALKSLAKASDLSLGRTLKTIAGLDRLNLNSRALQNALGTKMAVLKTLTGAAARSSLFYEFGWKPLLSDIQAIRQTMSEAEKRIKRILRNENRILTSHWSCPLEQFPTSGTDQTRTRQVGNFVDNTELMTYYLNLYVRMAKYTGTLKYSYTIDPWMRAHSKSLGLFDALGLSNDPQVLWNAIPFSFIVDYFAHLGNFIGQSKGRGLSPAVNILDFCHSIQIEYDRDLHIEVKTTTRPSYDKSLVHGQQVRYYLREPAVPGQVEQLKLRGFTKYKIRMLGTLLAALKLR